METVITPSCHAGSVNPPLDVGMVSRFFPPSVGGVQTHLQAVSEALASRGYTVRGYTTQTEEGDFDDAFDIDRTEKPSILGSRKLWSGARTLAEESDVIHVHASAGLLSTVTELAASRSGTPVVLTVHGVGTSDHPEYPLGQRLKHAVSRRATLRLADAIVSTSPKFTDIATRYVSESKIRAIPEGVDAQFYTPGDVSLGDIPEAPDLPPDANVLLSINMVGRIKGMQYVIQALPDLLKDRPDAHYVVVGDGDWMPVLRDLCEKYGVVDRVHFAGMVTDNETIRAYYRSADVVVEPSAGETTSISTMEALSTETPIVASPVGATDVLLGDDERGRIAEIFPPGSYNADPPKELGEEEIALLREEILWVLEHPEEAAELATAGREYILRHHDWEVITDELEAVYHELVE